MRLRLRLTLIATALILAGGGLASLPEVVLRVLGIVLVVAGTVLLMTVYWLL